MADKQQNPGEGNGEAKGGAEVVGEKPPDDEEKQREEASAAEIRRASLKKWREEHSEKPEVDAQEDAEKPAPEKEKEKREKEKVYGTAEEAEAGIEVLEVKLSEAAAKRREETIKMQAELAKASRQLWREKHGKKRPTNPQPEPTPASQNPAGGGSWNLAPEKQEKPSLTLRSVPPETYRNLSSIERWRIDHGKAPKMQAEQPTTSKGIGANRKEKEKKEKGQNEKEAETVPKPSSEKPPRKTQADFDNDEIQMIDGVIRKKTVEKPNVPDDTVMDVVLSLLEAVEKSERSEEKEREETRETRVFGTEAGENAGNLNKVSAVGDNEELVGKQKPDEEENEQNPRMTEETEDMMTEQAKKHGTDDFGEEKENEDNLLVDEGLEEETGKGADEEKPTEEAELLDQQAVEEKTKEKEGERENEEGREEEEDEAQSREASEAHYDVPGTERTNEAEAKEAADIAERIRRRDIEQKEEVNTYSVEAEKTNVEETESEARNKGDVVEGEKEEEPKEADTEASAKKQEVPSKKTRKRKHNDEDAEIQKKLDEVNSELLGWEQRMAGKREVVRSMEKELRTVEQAIEAEQRVTGLLVRQFQDNRGESDAAREEVQRCQMNIASIEEKIVELDEEQAKLQKEREDLNK